VANHIKTKTCSDVEGRFLTHRDASLRLDFIVYLPPISTPMVDREFCGNLLLSHDDYFTEKVEWSERIYYSYGFKVPKIDLKDPILLTPQKPQPRKAAAP